MKTKKSLLKSASSAIRKSRALAISIASEANSIFAVPEEATDRMPKIRAMLSELNQRVHEFNAYHNAANTK